MIPCDYCLHGAHGGPCLWNAVSMKDGKTWTCSCRGSTQKTLDQLVKVNSEIQQARDEERAAIVAFLRRSTKKFAVANQIEHGDHLNMKTYADTEIALAAKTAHEVNRAYCTGLGDHSHVAWEDAPEWQKSSALNGVRGVIAGNTPQQSHDSWLAEKSENGWVYGPVKDAEAKTHPAFLPYDKLPKEQKNKDLLFITTVKGVLGL